MQGILHLFVIRHGRGGWVRHYFTIAGGFKMCQPSLLPICSRHAFLSVESAIELFGEVGEAAAITVADVVSIAVAVAAVFIVMEYC